MNKTRAALAYSMAINAYVAARILAAQAHISDVESVQLCGPDLEDEAARLFERVEMALVNLMKATSQEAVR